jgi:hypothetical protein
VARSRALVLSPRVKQPREEAKRELQHHEDESPGHDRGDRGDEEADRRHGEPDGEGGRVKHRAGRKHNTWAKKARITREAACRAIGSAESLTGLAVAAETRAAEAVQKYNKHKRGGGQNSHGGGSSGGAWQPGANPLPPPPAPPAPAPPDLLTRLHEVEDRLARVDKIEVDSSPAGDEAEREAERDEDRQERDELWMSRTRSEELSTVSRHCMGCLRYGNVGGGKRISTTQFGWRTASDLAGLLGHSQSDIVEACRTSIDKTGHYRYEFEGTARFPFNSMNPSIRPQNPKSRKDRGCR